MILGSLVLIVLGYFFWQSRQVRHDFINRASEHSRMIAGMISFSLNNAQSSQSSIEQTIKIFLGGTIRFIDYLDGIEPFSPDELAAFAEEANLVGIRINRGSGVGVEAPSGWAPEVTCGSDADDLQHFKDLKLYLLTWRDRDSTCIQVGFDSALTDDLAARIGLDRLIRDMNRLPLISYLRLEHLKESSGHSGQPVVQLINGKGGSVAETIMAFGPDQRLVVGVDAGSYTRRIRQMKHEFVVFSVLMIFLGFFFTWILSRYQMAFLSRVRGFERQMARQHEEAALGRAAATISHEINNPLNAIGMGLQRLEMELEIPEEYTKLIGSMRQAVTRSSHIIGDLKQQALPLVPRFAQIDPRPLIEAVKILYQPRCEQQGIRVEWVDMYVGIIEADETILGQVIENVFKNAVEAQPTGGEIIIRTQGVLGHFQFRMENPGFVGDPSAIEKILEPYYTSKTKGAGLGLAVSRRIIEAHGGRIRVDVPEPGILLVEFELPVRQDQGEQHP
ncbi:MAG: hypothetical protein KJ950_09965 [Proteobacteria bacterium]|nr:hypothetical protein [Pseudomonadota bacterium]MBU1688981.1 hypothetical protein [Pseudomonadota bacterium]